ncbi:MAG: sialate O-acetylesterase [Henriciella sp.]|nr:sialate O-acetylesterase [Henriciella sp.]
MRLITTILIGLIASACIRVAPEAEAPEVYHLYFLGGQSNMEGFGFTSDLPEMLQGDVDNTLIFQGKSVEDGAEGGGVGVWQPLRPGHGVLFDTDGVSNQLSDRFGPELSFAHGLQQSPAPQKIAIIKYVRGGTGLVDGVSGYGSWDPDYETGNGRNQYDNALTAIDQALSTRDIDGDGREDILVPTAIIWMQGEADAYDNLAAATDYEANLSRLMNLLRAALRVDDLPVVLGRIQDSGTTPETQVMAYVDLVQQAQAAFARNDPCADLVTVTETFSFLPDGWHYESSDYLRLGAAFADQVLALQQRCGGG